MKVPRGAGTWRSLIATSARQTSVKAASVMRDVHSARSAMGNASANSSAKPPAMPPDDRQEPADFDQGEETSEGDQLPDADDCNRSHGEDGSGQDGLARQ